MADLSILDRLRFVASQQKEKKRSASNLVSLSQDSSSSTQPVRPPVQISPPLLTIAHTNRQLSRQSSDATTAVTCAKPNHQLIMTNQSIAILYPVITTEVHESQTEELLHVDQPPMPSDWSVYSDILSEIKRVSEGVDSIRQNLETFNKHDNLDLDDQHPLLMLQETATGASDVRLVDPTSYEATVAVGNVVGMIPRPSKKRARDFAVEHHQLVHLLPSQSNPCVDKSDAAVAGSRVPLPHRQAHPEILLIQNESAGNETASQQVAGDPLLQESELVAERSSVSVGARDDETNVRRSSRIFEIAKQAKNQRLRSSEDQQAISVSNPSSSSNLAASNCQLPVGGPRKRSCMIPNTAVIESGISQRIEVSAAVGERLGGYKAFTNPAEGGFSLLRRIKKAVVHSVN